MRLKSLVLFYTAALIFSPQAHADEWEQMIYIPARNGENPKIRDLESGKEKLVLQGVMGMRPSECPPEAFWADAIRPDEMTAGRIVECADGKAYSLKHTPEAALLGGLVLVPEPKPGTTDEPGPLKSPIVEPGTTPKADP